MTPSPRPKSVVLFSCMRHVLGRPPAFLCGRVSAFGRARAACGYQVHSSSRGRRTFVLQVAAQLRSPASRFHSENGRTVAAIAVQATYRSTPAPHTTDRHSNKQHG